MKWLVIILVALNLALAAYFGLGLYNPNVTHITLAPIKPEKLKILNDAEIQALPKIPLKVPSVALQAEAQPAVVEPPKCYEWGVFADAQTKKIIALMDKWLLNYSLKTTPVEHDAAHYWIYMPPKPTLELAQAKVEELKRLGIVDNFIVQEGPWKYAISFGMFKDESLADKLLEDLKKHGVRTAIKGDRNQIKDNNIYNITNMTPEILDELNKVKAAYPKAELNAVGCGNQ